MPFLTLFLTLILILTTTGFVLLCALSLAEGHRRAARLAALLALLSALFLALTLILPPGLRAFMAGIIIIALALVLAWLAWPSHSDITPSPPPNGRVDERTIIFARARLEPGTANYAEYYQNHPEHQAPDDAFRQNPGLLDPSAAFYHPLLASSPEGGFFLTEALRKAVDGPIAPNQISRPIEQITRFIKDLAAYHGAVEAGVCALQPYHIYSHIGRGTGEYGAPITLNHSFAIAIAVEMAREMINAAPRMPAVMESARQYAEAARIAVTLAAAIRQMGYPARAHIDGNYRVIAPLVARDAGLGEIGRMGLLMTPRLGPRVRLAVVTTDLPLVADAPTIDASMIDFCTHCQKCAAACPSQSIPFGERQSHPDGTLRWKINAETCFTYWTRIGTDCGRCMAVCPYAHPDNTFHNLVRLGVAHSSRFRRAAVYLDDFFYGKKPLPHAPPDWIRHL